MWPLTTPVRQQRCQRRVETHLWQDPWWHPWRRCQPADSPRPAAADTRGRPALQRDHSRGGAGQTPWKRHRQQWPLEGGRGGSDASDRHRLSRYFLIVVILCWITKLNWLKHFRTLWSLINAKFSQQRFWHCYENTLTKRIQTIPHSLFVSFKFAYLYCGLRLILVYLYPNQ